MTPVTTVSSMHEEVHERAKEERQVNERAQDVGAVLGKQKRAGNDDKPDQDESGS